MKRNEKPLNNLNEGLKYYHEKRYDEAIKYFSLAIKSDSKNAAALWFKAQALSKSGKDFEAIPIEREARTLDSNVEALCKNLSQEYLKNNQMKSNNENKLIENNDVNQLTDLFGNQNLNQKDYYQEGLNKFNSKGDYRYYAAIELFSLAIQANDNRALALLMRSLCFMKIGQNDNAIKDYIEAVKLNPQLVDKKNNEFFSNWCTEEGTTNIKLEKYQEAIKHFTLSLQLNPNAMAYFSRIHSKKDAQGYQRKQGGYD